MIQTETSMVWRFLNGLRLGLTGLVDTGRDGPELYADAIGRTIQHESQAKMDKGLSLGTGGGQKEVLEPSPLQIVGSQRSGGRFEFQTRKPNNQKKSGGSGGKPQIGGKMKSWPRNHGKLEQLGVGKQA